jgi:cytochrome c oxidase subunit 4
MSTNGHHVIPFDVYIKIFAALIVFTVITVVASQVDFGAWNVVIAMAIASIKAGLVLAYFMHLKYDDKLYVVMFGTGIFFLIVLFLFTFLDIHSRIPVNNPL